MRIAIISSSTRKQRISHRLALHLENRFNLQQNVTAFIIDVKAYQLPMLEDVIDDQVCPTPEMLKLRDLLDGSDAVVFVSPEYNGSFSPALKNLVDHLSKKQFRKKPIGVCSVSDGPMGGIRAAMQMQLLVMGVFGYPCPFMLLASLADKRFDEEGRLLDSSFEPKLEQFSSEFLQLARAIVSSKKESA